MNKAKEAIKYGLTTMGVTSKEMFSLIESSNGYDGDDYNRWLTNQIIQIAENDGVGYSQLLAKWFNIISSIEEDSSDLTIKDKWLSYIRDMLGNGLVYTVGMGKENDFGTDLTDIEWFEGVDIAWNTWFSDEKLPVEASEALQSGSSITFVVNTGVDIPVKKSYSLVQDAKSNGVACNSAGALMMYRMCNMLSAMECSDNFSVVLVSETSFLLDKGNAQIIKHFLNHFSYDGFVINSMDLYNSSFTSTDYAVMLCKPREATAQDGIVLPKAEGDIIGKSTKRYSLGGNMWGKLVQGSDGLFDCRVSAVNPDMTLSTECVNGFSKAMGYICKGESSRVPVLSTLPIIGTVYVPITMGNLGDVIAYYGVSQALHNSGLPCGIPEFLSGHPEYDMLVANCAPVFLFDINSKFKPYDNGISNPFDVSNSDLVKRMLDRSSQHYGYETKELVEICKGFVDFVIAEDKSISECTFEGIRAEANNEELNKAYISALSRCLDYIGTQYRRM